MKPKPGGGGNNIPAAITVTDVAVNGGSNNRSGFDSLTFQFSEATTVDAAGSLILRNDTTGSIVDVSGATLENNGSDAVTWDLSGIAFPDGDYTVTLPQEAAELAESHTEVLAGDSSGNGKVDFADLANSSNTIAGPAFGPGDLNGDGKVDFGDFGILANSFNNRISESFNQEQVELSSHGDNAFGDTETKDGEAKTEKQSVSSETETSDDRTQFQPAINARLNNESQRVYELATDAVFNKMGEAEATDGSQVGLLGLTSPITATM